MCERHTAYVMPYGIRDRLVVSSCIWFFGTHYTTDAEIYVRHLFACVFSLLHFWISFSFILSSVKCFLWWLWLLLPFSSNVNIIAPASSLNEIQPLIGTLGVRWKSPESEITMNVIERSFMTSNVVNVGTCDLPLATRHFIDLFLNSIQYKVTHSPSHHSFLVVFRWR